jgi:hypothetical protein
MAGEDSPCRDRMVTRTSARFSVAIASFSPTPNLPITLPGLQLFGVFVLREVLVQEAAPIVADGPSDVAAVLDLDVPSAR